MNNLKLIVALDNVRSTLNVGAILRTADGAGIIQVILGGITPSANHPKVIKTALGAEKFVATKKVLDLKNQLEEFKSYGYKIVSIEQSSNSINYSDYQVKNLDPIVLVFGNEITGVDPQILEISDFILELPMLGEKKSLNISTTVGIIAYHFRNYEIKP